MNDLSQPHKRALAYVRISSTRQIDGESPETQKDRIQQYADANSIDIVEWFDDEGKSAKNADREELQRLLAYALKCKEKDKIDYVIVYKMSRASRDLDSYITQVKTVLKSRGITVRSATEPGVDDTKQGKFMEGLLVLLGQLDNDTKSEYTVDNMKSLAAQGYWQHPPIVGYSNHRELNQLGKPRPTLKPNASAPLVKDVLERFSEGDISKAELTRYAANIGLRSRYGNKLSEDSINRLIKTPTYAGYVSDHFTEYALVEGKHAPIISKDTFETNQILLYGPNTKKGEVRRKNHPNYPLKGLVRCPNCKNALYASAPRTGAGGTSPRYHCSRASCKGLVRSIKSTCIHNAFIALLKQIKPSEHILSLYKEVLINEASQHLGKLNTKISRLRKELDNIADSRMNAIKKYNNDMLPLQEKKDLVNELDQDKLRVTGELNDLTKLQDIQEADIEQAINIMEQVDKQWEVSDLEIQQRFQSMLLPEGLTYDYKLGRFGTSQISPLYRYVPNKKDSEVTSKSFLVAGAGFEPAT